MTGRPVAGRPRPTPLGVPFILSLGGTPMRADLWLRLPALGRQGAATLTCALGDYPVWSAAVAAATALLADHPPPACAGLAVTPLLAAWAAHGAMPGRLWDVPLDAAGQAAALAPVPLA